MSWTKWECPDDFLTVERKLTSLQLTPQQLDELSMTYYDIELRKAKTPEERAAWATLKVKKQSTIVSKGVNESFVEDFQLWLQGRSKYNKKVLKTSLYKNGKIEKHERECTPWGNADLLHLPDVREWLKLPLLNRDLVIKELSTLKMKTPQDLEECWEYYKYIVRGVGIDGDSVKEQRNYNEYDYIEKRPVITNTERDKEGDIRIVPESDMRFTPLSIQNPSMPKFDEKGYKHVLSDSINKATTGDADLLDSDQFASLMPEDKLFVAHLLATNIKIDPAAFRELTDNGINSLVDQLTEYLDDAMDIDVSSASSKDEKAELRRKAAEEKKKLREEAQKRKEEERKRKEEEQKIKKKEKAESQALKKKEKAEAQEAKKQQKLELLKEKERLKEEMRQKKMQELQSATKGKEIEDLHAQIKALKEKKDKAASTESAKKTQKYIDDQIKKIKKETEGVFTERAKKSESGLKKQIAELTKQTEEFRQVIDGLEKKKKEPEMIYRQNVNLFPGRELKGGKIGEADVISSADIVEGPLHVAGFINNALDGLDVTNVWDKIFIENYYSLMTETLTKSIQKGGSVLGTIIAFIEDNKPIEKFDLLKKTFKDNMGISPLLSDLAETYYGNISDEISEKISRSFIQLATSNNSLERENAVHSLASIYGTSDNTDKTHPAIESIRKLAFKLLDNEAIDNYTASFPGAPEAEEVKNKLMDYMLFPRLVKSEAEYIRQTTGLLPYTKRTTQDIDKLRYIENSGKYYIQRTALEKNGAEEIDQERYQRHMNAKQISELLSEGMNVDVNTRPKLQQLGEKLKSINRENANAYRNEMLKFINDTMLLKKGSDSTQEMENLKKIIAEKNVELEHYKEDLDAITQNMKEQQEEERAEAEENIKRLEMAASKTSAERSEIYITQANNLLAKYKNVVNKWTNAGELDMMRDYEKRKDIEQFLSAYKTIKAVFPDTPIAEGTFDDGTPRMVEKFDEYRLFMESTPVYKKQFIIDVQSMLSEPEKDPDIFKKYGLIEEMAFPSEALTVMQRSLAEKKVSVDNATRSREMMENVSNLISISAQNLNNAEVSANIQKELANIERETHGFFTTHSIDIAGKVKKLLSALGNLAQEDAAKSAELERLRHEMDETKKQVQVFNQPKLDMEESLTEDQILNREFAKISANYINFMSKLDKNRIDKNDRAANDYVISQLNELHRITYRYGARQAELKNNLEKISAHIKNMETRLGEEGGSDINDFAQLIRDKRSKETIALGLDSELASMWEYIKGYTGLLGNSQFHDPTSEEDKRGYFTIESGAADFGRRETNYRNAVAAFENMSRLTNDPMALYSADPDQIKKSMRLLDHIQSKMAPYGNEFSEEEIKIFNSMNSTILSLKKISSMTDEQKRNIVRKAIAEKEGRKRETMETEEEELPEKEEEEEEEQETIEIELQEGVTEVVKREGQEFAPSAEEQKKQKKRYSELSHKGNLTPSEQEELSKLKEIFSTTAKRGSTEPAFSSNYREFKNQPSKVEEPEEKKELSLSGPQIELATKDMYKIFNIEKPSENPPVPLKTKLLREISEAEIKKTLNNETELDSLSGAIHPYIFHTRNKEGLSATDATTKIKRKKKLDGLSISELKEEKVHVEDLHAEVEKSVKEIVKQINAEREKEAKELGLTPEEYRKHINRLDLLEEVTEKEAEELEEQVDVKYGELKKRERAEKEIKTMLGYWNNIKEKSEEVKSNTMTNAIFDSVFSPETRLDKLKNIVNTEVIKKLQEANNDEGASEFIKNDIKDQNAEHAIVLFFNLQREQAQNQKDRFYRYYHHGKTQNDIYLNYDDAIPKLKVPRHKYREFSTYLDYGAGDEETLANSLKIRKTMESLLSGSSKADNEYNGENGDQKSYALISDNLNFDTLSFMAINSALNLSSSTMSPLRIAKEVEGMTLGSIERNKEMKEGEKEASSKVIQKRVMEINRKQATIGRIVDEYIKRVESYQEASRKIADAKLGTIAKGKFDVGKFYRDMTLNVVYDSIGFAKELEKYTLEIDQEKMSRLGEEGRRHTIRRNTKKRDFLNLKYNF